MPGPQQVLGDRVDAEVALHRLAAQDHTKEHDRSLGHALSYDPGPQGGGGRLLRRPCRQVPAAGLASPASRAESRTKLKITVLSRGPGLSSTGRLVEACRARHAEASVLNPLHCVVKLSDRKSTR